MQSPTEEWEKKEIALWERFSSYSTEAFLAHIEELVAQLPEGHPLVPFERGCAFDSSGYPELAIPQYREAIAKGISGLRKRRTSIQLASSLRNLGKLEESLSILEAELRSDPDELDGAVRGFLALVLHDQGRKDEALLHSLQALSVYLPRYNQSLFRYAGRLVDKR
ncbi:tetratricopeptide repeat protein [Gallaecimonas kandeliae]|uniref:tetratricopeptide repeat protein n=1 Tax=Gallaecimonas kandeliae TaxID=3029055 RepID=UPI002648279D|nr:tetratricopeptide repeat protein [Gallaecimonas kandeliae]WKE66989.1 tetratricopeptide repeat protein [Gallaecimonas kandeliae]